MVKTLKILFSRTNRPMSLKLGMQVLPKFLNYDPGLTLTHFTPKLNLVTRAFTWAKVKIMYYLETLAAISLKGGLNIQINELLKLNEYRRSRSLFEPWPMFT